MRDADFQSFVTIAAAMSLGIWAALQGYSFGVSILFSVTTFYGISTLSFFVLAIFSTIKRTPSAEQPLKHSITCNGFALTDERQTNVVCFAERQRQRLATQPPNLHARKRG